MELTGPSPAVTSPRAVEMLSGGAEAFPRMLAAIDAAERFVHLEVYTFARGRWGDQFLAALSRARWRGVAVRVIVDGWGSVGDAREIKETLRGAGIRVTVFNPLTALLSGRLWRNHRKILLVDDQLAYVGGINIADEYATEGGRLGWADLALEIRGSACSDLGRRLRGEKVVTSPGPVRVYLSGWRGGGRLRKRYLRAISSAREQLVIAHAYFLPNPQLVRALIAAAHRGVRVKLLLAGKSDIKLAQLATMRLYRKFLTAEVEIHEWMDSTLHAKTAVVDGKTLLVGSFNLDPLSLVNLEALVEVDEPASAEQVSAWIEAHIARSRRISLEDVGRSPLLHWVTEVLGLVLTRMAEQLARYLGTSGRTRRRLERGRRNDKPADRSGGPP